jgi:hypothetical protein
VELPARVAHHEKQKRPVCIRWCGLGRSLGSDDRKSESFLAVMPPSGVARGSFQGGRATKALACQRSQRRRKPMEKQVTNGEQT